MNDTTTPPADRLWNVEEVARFLGVSTSWVYQHAASSDLPYRRIGGLLRFFPADVHAYARGQQPEVAPVLPLRR